jgi:CheY-like chemotaxis protein
MTAMARVLIVDDYDPFRERLRTHLERAGFEVVGEAGDGEAAIEAVGSLRPDVVVLDVQLPGRDGFDVCERILASPAPPIVVLTSGRAEGTYRRRLAGSGARGFIPKAELTAATLTAVLGTG